MSSIRRSARCRRSILVVITILVRIARRRRWSSRRSTVIYSVLVRIRIRLSVSCTLTVLPSRLKFPKFIRLLTRSRVSTSSTPVFIVSRSLDCILGYFNNLASLSLFASSLHAEIDMHGIERTEHCLIERHVVRMDSRGMLSKIIKSRKCFSTMAREWSFTSMFSIDVSTRGNVDRQIRYLPYVPGKMF